MTANDLPGQPAGNERTAALTLAALGVVFGDIGTSPLYTVKECFSEYTGIRPTPENVLGILSLITWALIPIVAVKYVAVVMRADNKGEGGVLALMALVSRQSNIHSERRRRVYLMLGIAGAALFYGDCSADARDLGAERGRRAERRHTRFPAAGIAHRARCDRAGCSPCSVSAPAGIGHWFGPITLLWFVVLFVLGLRQLVDNPSVLAALAASCRGLRDAGEWLRRLPGAGRRHPGRHRRRSALCRHGSFRRQADPAGLAGPRAAGAAGQLLRTRRAAAGTTRPRSPIRSSCWRPDWALYPLVGLATAATVIASQATDFRRLLDGQASGSLLGLSPRVHIEHTSASEFGQVYLPVVNWLQLVGHHHPGAGVQVLDQPRCGLRHRRHRHDAGDQRAGVRTGRARLEVGRGSSRSWCSACFIVIDTSPCSRPTC